MAHQIGLEELEPGHWIAWVLDLPGCYSAAPTRDAALAGIPESITLHLAWLQHHGQPTPSVDDAPPTIEEFAAFHSLPDYLVNAFFADDARPLSAEEIARGLALLACTRRDLLDAIEQLSPAQRATPLAGEVRETIDGILLHVANVENWYLGRLDLALPPENLPLAPLLRLSRVRDHFRATFPTLTEEARTSSRMGEQWSARKVLRRALWHEQDHARQIAGFGGG